MDPAVWEVFGSFMFCCAPLGEKFSEVGRSEMSLASGATPTKPSVGDGLPAMMDAVRVPWESQSCSPSPSATKSPPGCAGTRGEALTPVSITATVTPAPVANFCASGICR